MTDIERIKEYCKNEKSQFGCSISCPLFPVCYYCDFSIDSFCPHTAQLCVDILDRHIIIKEKNIND